VRVWEGRTGKFVATLRGHIGAVYRLAWSADSRLLVSASKDSTLKVCVLPFCFRWMCGGVDGGADELGWRVDLGFEDVQDQDGFTGSYG
jgi:WD domain, G-beta repeat